jgi:hypothetical protein
VRRLSGVREVSKKASRESWTGSIYLQENRLPDLKAWKREFENEVGKAFTIEGVEATIDGHLVEASGRMALQIGKTTAIVELQPLQRKVQIDPEKKLPQAPTAGEKDAHKRLLADWKSFKGPPPRIRIIGPLGQTTQLGVPALTVREYFWAE